jgi:protein-disulfide isomerase
MMKYLMILSLVFLASCTNNTNTWTNNPPSTSSTASVSPQVLIPSPTFGSGKHTLTLYADFQCPACIAFAKILGPIFEDYASRGFLVITYKQFPLTSIHPNAERDALAALCSAEQGKYMEYKKALYALEEAKKSAKVSDADRIEAAKGILDEEKLTECLKTDKYLPQVRAEMAEGDAKGVNGTPTVFLDGKKLDPAIYRDPVALRTILDRLLEVPNSSTDAATGTGK